MDKSKQIQILTAKREQIASIRSARVRSIQFRSWEESALSVVSRIFGKDSLNHERFFAIDYEVWSSEIQSVDEERNIMNQGLDQAYANLTAFIEEIELFGDGKFRKEDQRLIPVDSKSVFIIHGHDEVVRLDIARTLERLGLNPIILHEQANEGKTIIEKFEKNTDVGFAIALLTPDDQCLIKDTEYEFTNRARQNVILELGYFAGKLGRDRVMALVKGDIEIPSDFSGVVYTPMIGESWKHQLVRELKNAGYDVDANKLY